MKRTKISIAKRVGALLSEEMKAQPAAISSRNALGLAKERDEQKKHEISVDLRLEFEITREIFRGDFTCAILELKRGVESVIDLFHEGDEGSDVVIA